jgi:ADP-L-glycero-D-manno-heptose 6-epimerase
MNGKKPFLYKGVKDYLRDFLYIEDACRIMIQLMKNDFQGIINIGTGVSHRIADVFEAIFSILNWTRGYEIKKKEASHIEIKQQVLDTSLLQKQLPHFKFIGLKEGIEKTIGWYCET